MISVNGRPLQIEKEISVKELLYLCNYTYPLIVVRLNGRTISPEEFEKEKVRSGDSVEAIHLVAGG
jgi:sulfur carrier protein